MPPELDFKKVEPPESKRTYIFPSGKVSFEGVKAVCARPSGTHRLELMDGRKVIVPPGWLAIELEIENWSF